MEIIKHLDYFDPNKVAGKRIAVIGAGATGTATILKLAKLGLLNTHLYDFDKIERHNISNQILYSDRDVGKLKVKVAARNMKLLMGYEAVIGCNEEIFKKKLRADIVFICVDSMKARTAIFDNAIFLNGRTDLMIDMRMAATSVHVCAFNPSNMDHVDCYRSTLYSDDVVPKQLGNCGVTPSIAATAGIAADFSIWRFMDWIMGKNRSIFDINLELPYTLVHRTFDNVRLELSS